MRLTFSFILLLLLLLLLLLADCNSKKEDQTDKSISVKKISKDDEIKIKIDSLKLIAKDGDLITRMNDNIISYQAMQLNEVDKSFSHAGIVVTKNNVKMVCHIIPEAKPADTVTYEPIDSFINPKYNLSCGLFRYDLSDSERIAFINQLDLYHKDKIHFDLRYDVNTDNVIYCSEMIYKALKKATNNRIECKLILIPRRLLPLLKLYFKKYNPAKNEVEDRKYVTIDNLYLVKGCKELMRFSLKYFPGQ